MTCQFSLHKAEADQATIATVKENFRNHLLMALSEARAATVNLEPDIRDKLMDDLGAYFHPEAAVGDYFVDAFSDAEKMAQDRINELADETVLQRRTPAWAAE